MKRMKIGKTLVGEGRPCFLIAEVSCNHQQKKGKALRLIELAKKSGADAVKFQAYTPDTLTLDSGKPLFRIKGTLWHGRKLHELYGQAYTPWEWFPELRDRARQEGLEFFSSAYDESAVDFLQKLKVPAYKIASFEINHIPLLRKVGSSGKPVIISSGVATEADLRLAVRTLRASGCNQVAILKCTSAYPAPYSEMNLRTIPDIEKRFGVVAGLSDHTLGTAASVAAVALGAKIIEKHFIASRSDGGPDAPFSIEPKEFAQMAKSVRQVEAALGKVSYELGAGAKKHRFFSRSIFATREIAKGERLTGENTAVLRPWTEKSAHPLDYGRLLLRRAARRIGRGEPINWDSVA